MRGPVLRMDRRPGRAPGTVGAAPLSAPGEDARTGAEPTGANEAPRIPTVAGPYEWYGLGLLFVVYVFNFIDRQILSILAQPIKEDLGVSDTLMGLLGGIAFALFYTFLGIPIARLADTHSRRIILASCLTIWSVMTALCGFAANFLQLMAARIGVAVGEAGGSPPSHSMISDMFPPHRRATALAVYALGIPVGSALGNLLGGRLNDLVGWRQTFLIVGLPGVLLALLVFLTLREPARGASEARRLDESEAPPVFAVFRYLWGLKSFRYMALGGGLHAFVGYGVGYWIPAFFIRTHEFTSSRIGDWLFVLGFGGMLGTFLGGWMGDRLGARDRRWYVWLPGLATLASVPFAAFTYASDQPVLALTVYFLPVILGSYYLGPTFALTQGLVGLRMRALASSILLFILNLIGLGLGPWFTGTASDALRPMMGDESLRGALLITLVFNVVSAGLYLLAGRTLAQDLARADDSERLGEARPA
jgi:predicted MFS family arabinose efflux permease